MPEATLESPARAAAAAAAQTAMQRLARRTRGFDARRPAPITRRWNRTFALGVANDSSMKKTPSTS